VKKSLASLLLFAVVLAGAAQTRPDFEVVDHVLIKYRGQDRDVVIPAGLGINRIGSRAFAGTQVYTVKAPVGVNAIDERAFAGCSFLKAVSLPNTLTVLGRRAFFNCVLLETVNIPRSLISIEDGAFFNCSSLKTIDLPDTLKSVGDRAFSGCLAMESISVSARTRVSANAFMGIPCKITWKN
jgi:hypothetical protein